MKLIPTIFKSFFEFHSFVELPANYSNIKSYVNKDISLNFIFDNRYNEVTININNIGSDGYLNLLTVFEKLMTKEHRDVFAFLKNEFNNLEPSLQKIYALNLNDSNAFFLLACCSILIKNYEDIIIIVKSYKAD